MSSVLGREREGERKRLLTHAHTPMYGGFVSVVRFESLIPHNKVVVLSRKFLEILGETAQVNTTEGGQEKGGVELAQKNKNLFHYRRATFYSQLNSEVGNILTKATALCINLNTDVDRIASHSYTRELRV